MKLLKSLPQPDRAIAIVLSLAALLVYANALPPSYAYWDTGELQVVSILLGLDHPPGSPAFVLLGWLFSHVIPFGEQAWRVNFLSSSAVAVSIGLLYSTARRLSLSRVYAAVCALGFAVAPEVLVYATRAETQDLVLLFASSAVFFGARYDATRSIRDLFCMSLAFGLLAATHGVAIFLLPALVLLVALRRPQREDVRGACVAVVAGIVIGLLPYAYIEPRSAYLFAHRVDPTLALGIPPGAPFWDYDNPSASPAQFWRFVTGADFHVHSGFAGYLDVTRYPAYALGLEKRLAIAYGYPGMLLAAIGAGFLLFRREAIGKSMILASILVVPYTESYADLQDPDRYYMLALWCAAIGIGLSFRAIVALLWRTPPVAMRAFFALTLVVIFATASSTRTNIFQQRNDETAPGYVAYLRGTLPDNAIVLAEWAYSSPIAYASYVEHSFGNRIAVSAGPTQYESHYDRWLQGTRPIYIVSFDDNLDLPGYRIERVSLDRSFYVYQLQKK